MRVLTALHIVTELASETYAPTPVSRLLVAGSILQDGMKHL